MTKHTYSTDRWIRIPDGTRVRHCSEAYESVIEGLPEIIASSERETQCRVKVGDSPQLLVAENHLNILLDQKNVALVDRESNQYRQAITDRLRAVLAENRFMALNDQEVASPEK